MRTQPIALDVDATDAGELAVAPPAGMPSSPGELCYCSSFVPVTGPRTPAAAAGGRTPPHRAAHSTATHCARARSVDSGGVRMANAALSFGDRRYPLQVLPASCARPRREQRLRVLGLEVAPDMALADVEASAIRMYAVVMGVVMKGAQRRAVGGLSEVRFSGWRRQPWSILGPRLGASTSSPGLSGRVSPWGYMTSRRERSASARSRRSSHISHAPTNNMLQ